MDGNGLAAAVSRTPGDRLSALPDDLLLQILVLLPLLEAVRTCVLSRRWTRLWTQLAILNVVDTQVDGGGEPGRFARFVDGIISVYSHRLDRACCYLCISISREDSIDGGRLTTWARLAAELFNGDFTLSVDPVQPKDSEEYESDSEEEEEEEIFELPYFEFAKQITLTLRDRFLRLAFPTDAGAFASLIKLVLMKLHFADAAGAALSEVVSSRCPCLVSLFVLHVQGATALTLRAASLTQLTLTYVHGLRLLDVVVPKLRVMAVQSCFVESQGRDTELLISAPLLQRFEWADFCPERTQFGRTDHLNTLVVWEISAVTWDVGSVAHSNFHMILSHFRRTHVLELHLPIRPVSTRYFI